MSDDLRQKCLNNNLSGRISFDPLFGPTDRRSNHLRVVDWLAWGVVSWGAGVAKNPFGPGESPSASLAMNGLPNDVLVIQGAVAVPSESGQARTMLSARSRRRTPSAPTP